MVSFIDDHRGVYGVEPICKVLPIAPSTYYEHKQRQAHPDRRSARARREERLRPVIRRVWNASRGRYGARRVWKDLKQTKKDWLPEEEAAVARCTVERWMRAMELKGVMRRRCLKTTIPDIAADRPLDLVQRDFRADRPNQLWVADLT